MRCRGVEELGAYRSRIEQLGVPDSASPRGSDVAMSWPCTPSKADHRSSPAPGLFRRALPAPVVVATPLLLISMSRSLSRVKRLSGAQLLSGAHIQIQCIGASPVRV